MAKTTAAKGNKPTQEDKKVKQPKKISVSKTTKQKDAKANKAAKPNKTKKSDPKPDINLLMAGAPPESGTVKADIKPEPPKVEPEFSSTFPEITGSETMEVSPESVNQILTQAKKAEEEKPQSKHLVIFYHRDIVGLYKQHWIDKCILSIANQTMKDFDVLELNYSPTNGDQLVKIPGGRYHHFYHIPMEDHTYAMNFCLDTAFNELGYEVVFNVNMDDYYAPNRFERQLEFLSRGYDLVSSDFCYIKENVASQEDYVTLRLNILQYGDIQTNLLKNPPHNMIAHPCVAYTKRFWDAGLKYNNIKPMEDMDLWKRACLKGLRLGIVPEELLFYRRHENQICK